MTHPTFTAEPTSTPVGRLQLVAGGRDITYFRDAPTPVPDYSSAEPFGDAAGVVHLPQLSILDEPGVGDLDWLQPWADVDVNLLPADGSPARPLWEGLVASLEDDDAGGLKLVCIGALYQLDLYKRAPQLRQEEVEVAAYINNQFDQARTRAALRLTKPPESGANEWLRVEGDPSAFTTRQTGAWNQLLTGYLQEELAFMQDPATGRQWTLTLDRPRIPVLKLKDTSTVHWTVDAAAPGVEPRLKHDLTVGTTVIYGEGTDEAGTVWRRANYDTGAVFYEPLAHAPGVHGDTIDPSIIRIEQHISYGYGVSQATAIDDAEHRIARDADPGWLGSVTLDSDPLEGSRLEIREGHNILVRGYRGRDLILHIASAQLSGDKLTVRLTVDTKARDLLTVVELLARNRDSADPTGRLRRDRTSGIVEDTRVPWDTTAGSGYIPRRDDTAGAPAVSPDAYIHCPAGQWTVARFHAAEKASIRNTVLEGFAADGTPVTTPFYVSILDREPTDLPADPADLLTAPPEGEIEGWGVPGERAGYSPGLESAGDAPTGRLVDEGTWQIALDPGRAHLWIAIHPAASAYFRGRLHQGVE